MGVVEDDIVDLWASIGEIKQGDSSAGLAEKIEQANEDLKALVTLTADLPGIRQDIEDNADDLKARQDD